MAREEEKTLIGFGIVFEVPRKMRRSVRRRLMHAGRSLQQFRHLDVDESHPADLARILETLDQMARRARVSGTGKDGGL